MTRAQLFSSVSQFMDTRKTVRWSYWRAGLMTGIGIGYALGMVTAGLLR